MRTTGRDAGPPATSAFPAASLPVPVSSLTAWNQYLAGFPRKRGSPLEDSENRNAAGRDGQGEPQAWIRAVAPGTDGPDAIDLLDADAVVAAAGAAGADALHPGFGFLAENAEFAERVIAAGIRWIGPPPDAIRAMGDKAASRKLAASLGITVPAGYDDADQSDAALTAAAERIGYPLLVKPAAGGGGKGMRTVRDADRLATDLAAARREALAAFDDDRLILERLLEGARHVEIQVLFDGQGNGVHLGERDCSIQRRHQKVLEEAPSPAVDAACGEPWARRPCRSPAPSAT